MNLIRRMEHLQNRGVCVSGHPKLALAEITTTVNKIMLPSSCNFEEWETLDNERFYINEKKIENPFTSPDSPGNNFADPLTPG